MIKLEVQNLKRINHYLLKLLKLKKSILDQSDLFLKDVRKSARLLAPRFKGELANSITISKVGDKTIVLKATAPHASRMEFGKGLPAYVSIRTLLKSGWLVRTRKGYKSMSRTRGVRVVKGNMPPKKGYARITHYKPFLSPALEKNLGKFSQRLNKRVSQTIRGVK